MEAEYLKLWVILTVDFRVILIYIASILGTNWNVHDSVFIIAKITHLPE